MYRIKPLKSLQSAYLRLQAKRAGHPIEVVTLSPSKDCHGGKTDARRVQTRDVVVLSLVVLKMTVTEVGNNFGGSPKVWRDWLEESKEMTGAFDPTSVKRGR
jgi:hypothetical protein